MSGTMNSVRNSTMPSMRDFTARDIAQSIINNYLDEQSVRRGQMIPDVYRLPTFPSEPSANFEPEKNLLPQFFQQRGGKT